MHDLSSIWLAIRVFKLKINCTSLLTEILYKMITRKIFTYCCCIALFVPASGWAVSDTDITPVPPVTQPELAKPAPDKSVPATPAAAPATSGKPVAAIKPPVTSAAPANNEPALLAPSSPDAPPSVAAPAAPTVKRLPLRKAPVARHPLPAQSAPVSAPVVTQPLKSGTGIEPHTLDIEIFDREDCLQCDKAREFLTRLKSLQPQLKIITRDVRKEPAALQLLKRMAQNQGNTELDYPAFVVGGQLIIGFSEEAGTAQLILDTLAASRPASQQDEKNLPLCKTGAEPGCALIPVIPEEKPQAVTFNILGYNVQLGQIGMPLFTIAMGMLDGLNHSSLWVLMLIITLLAPAKNRSQMFVIAGTFIMVQGLIYFMLMSVWFNLITKVDISRLTQILFAILALVAGATYFKKYLFFGQSISVASGEINKPGIYTRIRKITESNTLAAALLGTIALSALLQLSELPYTSVFPALYTRVLHLQHLGNLSNYSYLLLYDFAYMLDDLIVFTLGLISLNSISLKKFNPQTLMLISALVTMSLGAYLLLVKP